MGIETMVAISLASTAASGVASFMGSQQSSKAAQESAMYQAQVAQNNAALAKQKAAVSEQVGQEQAAQQGRKTSQVLAAQRAALAAAGVDVNAGTAVDLQEATARTGRLDTLHLFDNAMQQAFGFQSQAADYTNQGNLARMSAKNAKAAGDIAGVSSLISTAGSFSNKWAGFSRTGAAPSFGGMFE